MNFLIHMGLIFAIHWLLSMCRNFQHFTAKDPVTGVCGLPWRDRWPAGRCGGPWSTTWHWALDYHKHRTESQHTPVQVARSTRLIYFCLWIVGDLENSRKIWSLQRSWSICMVCHWEKYRNLVHESIIS